MRANLLSGPIPTAAGAWRKLQAGDPSMRIAPVYLVTLLGPTGLKFKGALRALTLTTILPELRGWSFTPLIKVAGLKKHYKSPGHSGDTLGTLFWTLRSPGPGGPRGHPVGHSLGHPPFSGTLSGTLWGHFGPEGPERLL